MAKMSLKWHKDCLKNIYSSLERKKVQLEALKEEVSKLSNEAGFYHVQIHEAEASKKDGFDSELFMKKIKHYYIKRGQGL